MLKEVWTNHGVVSFTKNNTAVILATSLFLVSLYTMSVHMCVSYDVLWYRLGCVFSCRL